MNPFTSSISLTLIKLRIVANHRNSLFESVDENVFNRFEQSWWVYLSFKDICARLKHFYSVFAFALTISIMIVDSPLLATQQLYFGIFIVCKCAALAFFIGV